MTEFNAQEIIRFLKRNFLKKVSTYHNEMTIIYDEVIRGDDEAIELASVLWTNLHNELKKMIENVRKVERYAVEVEKYGKSCATCRITNPRECGDQGHCKTQLVQRKSEWWVYKLYKPRYTLGDFK